MHTQEVERMLKPDDVARMMSVDVATIRAWEKNRQIPRGIRVGRVVRWPAGVIAEWIRQRSEQSE